MSLNLTKASCKEYNKMSQKPHEMADLIAGLDNTLNKASKVLGELEHHHFNVMHNQDDSSFNEGFELDVFASILDELQMRVAFTLDALNLTDSRLQFLSRWKKYEDKLDQTSYYPEVDALHSDPYILLANTIQSLRLLMGDGESPALSYHRDLLEKLLQSTAVLLRKRDVIPKSEADIQRVMNDYLSATFIDYIPHPQIPGHLKHFKPDGGVRSLNAAIEYKFVRSEAELKVALSGIMEDTAGYAGSLDWTRFYSVIYMTEPFESVARFEQDLHRISANSWKAYLVNQGVSSNTSDTKPGKKAVGQKNKATKKKTIRRKAES